MTGAVFDAEVVDGVGQLGAADGDAFVQVDAVQASLPNILDLESKKEITLKPLIDGHQENPKRAEIIF